MLEEALPIAAGVGVALLPAMAFGGLAAVRAFVILGGEESGFFKALEEGKSEEEALKMAGAIASPREPYASESRAVVPAVQQRAAPAAPVVAHSPMERISRVNYGFAAGFTA